MTYWIIAIIAAPLVVYGLTKVSAMAWFRTKRAHIKAVMDDFGKDN